jgi:hypothetical protein
MGILMAATVASPLAAQTAETSTERRGGFGSRVRDAVRSERPERQQQSPAPRAQRRQTGQDDAAPRAARRDRRQATRQERPDQPASQARPRTWGQSVNGAIQSEKRQEREARLQRERERAAYRQWRNDPRYDWERWRYANRGLYRGGGYYSPWDGYRYRPLSIGVRLGSPFYSHRYWISDPGRYRLPPEYPGTRWVRYYDDVVLVDMYDGQVLDVIRNFFW